MNALAKIDGVMPWVSASAQADLREARNDVTELLEAVNGVLFAADNGLSVELAIAYLRAAIDRAELPHLTMSQFATRADYEAALAQSEGEAA